VQKFCSFSSLRDFTLFIFKKSKSNPLFSFFSFFFLFFFLCLATVWTRRRPCSREESCFGSRYGCLARVACVSAFSYAHYCCFSPRLVGSSSKQGLQLSVPIRNVRRDTHNGFAVAEVGPGASGDDDDEGKNKRKTR
jgi:hypothetical protein